MNLFTPLVILPESPQFQQPARRLWIAVLALAWDDVWQHSPGSPLQRARQQFNALAWFFSDDATKHPGTFVNIAAFLGLDVSAARARLPVRPSATSTSQLHETPARDFFARAQQDQQ